MLKLNRNFRFISILLLLLLFLSVISLCVGEQLLFPNKWFSNIGQIFVLNIRLPRTIAVIMVGAALALSGAIMQTMFDNSLAEPGLLGVSNGAGVGIVFSIMFSGDKLSQWSIGACAITGALIITSILLYFSRKKFSINHLLLTGIALGIICSAIMTWAIYFSTSADLRQLMFWMMGGFGGINWSHSWLMISLVPVLLWSCFQSQYMNILALGESPAKQLGLSVWFWRKLFVVAVGWLVGVSVALAGSIGFIGLIIPHILRLLGIIDHKVLLPGCIFAGATGLLLADIISRIILNSSEIPIGVVTSTLGAPMFIWLLLRTSR
ncbi:vitamin B12 ABC transporter permease BtuC [Escherichia coli]|nr:vitamin B12 ABC transporter permease BtuC [Escherichia coli]EJD9551184.1 vitamin B12 ABC transporter permease BtuC [Escherichia coli]MED9213408.1 vitamin B12 ABC transporter permease BtuC [Escherichia coli]GCN02318.1 vitamin B12 ABC transporter permease [Escherichia coli]HBN7020050.1 vitamin B12 ABC transporter permease BtuC [Escherichia coli]HBN7541852.1 vitamin B12 ABC transporter permease BtuC [Escherichia coli]